MGISEQIEIILPILPHIFIKLLITRVIDWNCASYCIFSNVDNLLIKHLKKFFVGKCGVIQIFFVSLQREIINNSQYTIHKGQQEYVHTNEYWKRKKEFIESAQRYKFVQNQQNAL